MSQEDRFYQSVRRFLPAIDQMDDLNKAGAMLNVRIFLSTLPFAVLAVIWLVIRTELSVLIANWQVLFLLTLYLYVMGRFEFEVSLELRPGQYSTSTGNLSSLILWATILLFGPVVLWGYMVLILKDYLNTLVRETDVVARFGYAGGLALNISIGITGYLLGTQIYELSGGKYPFSGFTLPTLGAAAAAILTYFLFSSLAAIPLFLRVVRTSEFWQAEGLTTTTGQFLKYLLLVNGLTLLVDPFAILAAGIYVELGVGIFAFFAVAVLLVNLLANRLSLAARRSARRSRELATLEELGRAIIDAPPDATTLPDILPSFMLQMFTKARLYIWFQPDTVVYRSPGVPVMPAREVTARQQIQEGQGAYYHEQNIRLPDQPRILRDWLVVPIQNETGEVLGGISLFLRQDAGDIWELLPALQSLAAQIASALHRAEVYKQTLASEKMARELEVAGRIQASFLPTEVPQLDGWDIAATLVPARQTSGDFYDFVYLDSGRLAIVVADVADKGTGAALYMALSRTLIRTYAMQYPDEPDRVLQAANERILSDAESDQFVTVFYGVVDPESGGLTYANAGHNPAFLVSQSQAVTVQKLSQTGIPLGMFEGMSWRSNTVNLMAGDVLLVYTDGVSEAQDAGAAEYGEERLLAAAQSTPTCSASQIQAHIMTSIQTFVGTAPQFDDITLMVLCRL